MSSVLSERLRSGDARVRRVAALDLIRRARADADTRAEAVRVLAERLAVERDARVGLTIVGFLEESGLEMARAALWRAYEDRSTPVVIAHAAVVAHDRMLGEGGVVTTVSTEGTEVEE